MVQSIAPIVFSTSHLLKLIPLGTVSVAKAEVIHSLNAQTSILAGANPVGVKIFISHET